MMGKACWTKLPRPRPATGEDFDIVYEIEGKGCQVIINSPSFYCTKCRSLIYVSSDTTTSCGCDRPYNLDIEREEDYPDYWIPVRVVVIDQRPDQRVSAPKGVTAR